MNNKNSDDFFTQFSKPWRGIAVIIIWLAAAPPVQVIIAAFMGHDYIGGRRLLFEISNIFLHEALPKIMTGYSFYMPAVFLAALWSAWQPAKGAALTLGGAISRMVIVSLACEVFFQIFVVARGLPVQTDRFLLDIVQAVISAFICWLIARRFGIAKDSPPEAN